MKSFNDDHYYRNIIITTAIQMNWTERKNSEKSLCKIPKERIKLYGLICVFSHLLMFVVFILPPKTKNKTKNSYLQNLYYCQMFIVHFLLSFGSLSMDFSHFFYVSFFFFFLLLLLLFCLLYIHFILYSGLFCQQQAHKYTHTNITCSTNRPLYLKPINLFFYQHFGRISSFVSLVCFFSFSVFSFFSLFWFNCKCIQVE